MKFEWFGKEVLKAVDKEMADTSEEIGKKVEKDAIRRLIRTVKTTTSGGLKDQFSRTTEKDGTVLVWCQGPRKWKKPFHASFVELGTYKDEAQPFLRPAMKENKRPAIQLFKKKLDKI